MINLSFSDTAFMASATKLVKNPTNHHERSLDVSLKTGIPTTDLARRMMPSALALMTRHQQTIDYFAYPASQRGYRHLIGNSAIEICTEARMPVIIHLFYSDRENLTEGRSPSAITSFHIRTLVKEICRLAPRLVVCDDSLEDLEPNICHSLTLKPSFHTPSNILTFFRPVASCSSFTPHASP